MILSLINHISGEAVSRASRDRGTTAIGASPDAEGYHIDWLFTVHNGIFRLLIIDSC